MTYKILKLVFDWAVDGQDNDKHGREYRQALTDLALALARVMRFN
jgi:hypothetical protein